MADQATPLEVWDRSVRCSGPEDAPHPARALYLPAETLVSCPVCGLTYQRANGWQGISPASWPKQE